MLGETYFIYLNLQKRRICLIGKCKIQFLFSAWTHNTPFWKNCWSMFTYLHQFVSTFNRRTNGSIKTIIVRGDENPRNTPRVNYFKITVCTPNSYKSPISYSTINYLNGMDLDQPIVANSALGWGVCWQSIVGTHASRTACGKHDQADTSVAYIALVGGNEHTKCIYP